jgi:hypothetical protein
MDPFEDQNQLVLFAQLFPSLRRVRLCQDVQSVQMPQF